MATITMMLHLVKMFSVASCKDVILGMQMLMNHLRNQEGQRVYIFNFLHLVKMIVVG